MNYNVKLSRHYTVGDGESYNSDMNNICASIIEHGTFSKWVKCTTPLQGKYLFVFGKNGALGFELMAYSEYFVQQSYNKVQLYSGSLVSPAINQL
jgi:hypothetical protein